MTDKRDFLMVLIEKDILNVNGEQIGTVSLVANSTTKNTVPKTTIYINDEKFDVYFKNTNLPNPTSVYIESECGKEYKGYGFKYSTFRLNTNKKDINENDRFYSTTVIERRYSKISHLLNKIEEKKNDRKASV